MITLRPYQEDLYNQIQSAKGNRILAVAPCGFGKTPLAFYLAEQTVGETLILTHRRELLNQHENSLSNFDVSANVRIASVFTEVRHLAEHTTPDLLILDEAHLSKAASWERVVDYYNTRTIGLTATPTRLDGRPLGDIFDVMVQGISHKELTAQNRLAPYDYYAPTELDMRGVRRSGGDYSTADVEPLIEKAIYGDIVKSYDKFASGMKAIAFCVSIKHAEEIADLFNSAGIPAAPMTGKDTKATRDATMQAFRDGTIKILTTCNIISEGISIDDCECCLLLRPTDSTALYIQQACRCMRYQPGKRAVVIDYVGNYTRHGLPDMDRVWSLDAPPTRPQEYNADGTLSLRVCPNCFKTFETAPICPFCGEEYKCTHREIEHIETVQLQQIKADQLEAEIRRKEQMREALHRARTKADLVKIARENGYNKKWVYIQAKLHNIKH